MAVFEKRQVKYVFVTGGVLSGVGKGITAASIGRLLKSRGLAVNIQKCDPYLNVDAGTLNPAEHGECFVTFDGAETDLDLGHYERFMDVELNSKSSFMSGRVLQKVIADERAGKYNGKTVQFIPHVTSAIQEEIQLTAEGFDIHIVEVGGTVGDYEGLSFIEAIRELSMRVGRENCVFVHVVYLPFLGASKEIKTKPAQNAVRELRGLGIVPDVLVARSEDIADQTVLSKLSLFSGVDEEAIVLLPNAQTIYEVPLTLEAKGIGDVLARKLSLTGTEVDMGEWNELVELIRSTSGKKVKIGIVAKYLDNQDTYISVLEAIRSAAWHSDIQPELIWVDAESLTSNESVQRVLAEFDGIVVPGGFGSRGVEGKILAAQYALTKKIPYLGLCLGMQVAVIAAARNAGLEDANSSEFDISSTNQVITTMDGQMGLENTGGTMRLGNYDCKLVRDSLAYRVYGQGEIVERHRHRYECNNEYLEQYSTWGIAASGVSPELSLVEVIEAVDHPFFLASQFHPELKSRPNRPHPMFTGFINAL